MLFITEGDRAFLARDFDSARAKYQQAIKLDPQMARAHLRMAQLHLSQNEVDDAVAVLETAARFVGSDVQLRVEVYFLRAMVAELTATPEQAVASWQAFAQNVASFGMERTEAPTPPLDSSSGEPADVPSAEIPSAASPDEPDEALGAVIKQSGSPPAYSGTVQERKRMVLVRGRTVEDSTAVKERIRKRFEEAQQSSASSR
jgi:tetratricopeptide (TPR) repeat protein